MAIIGLFAPFDMVGSRSSDGIVLTSVSPGPCPLACSFCGIRQRKERDPDVALTPASYGQAVSDLAQTGQLIGASVVGDEPLFEMGWAHTHAFLSAARANAVPAAVVTSGFDLQQRARALADLEISSLVVSLDGDAAEHNQVRRTEGAFERAVRGIDRLFDIDETFVDRLIVASVARPRHVDTLYPLLDRLLDIGIKRWVISPLLVIGNGHRSPRVILSDADARQLINLSVYAESCGIEFYFDADYKLAKELNDIEKSSYINIRFPNENVSIARLLPNGSVSIDDELLSVEKNDRAWDGETDLADLWQNWKMAKLDS